MKRNDSGCIWENYSGSVEKEIAQLGSYCISPSYLEVIEAQIKIVPGKEDGNKKDDKYRR